MLGFDVLSLLTLHLDVAQSKVGNLCATAIITISVAYPELYQGVEGGKNKEFV